MAKIDPKKVELAKLRRWVRNAEAVITELAKRPENRDTTNTYWLAKLHKTTVRACGPNAITPTEGVKK